MTYKYPFTCTWPRYDFGDAEIKRVLELDDGINKAFSGFVPEDVIPGLKYVYKSKTWKDIEGYYDELINKFIKRRFEEEEATFDRSNNQLSIYQWKNRFKWYI